MNHFKTIKTMKILKYIITAIIIIIILNLIILSIASFVMWDQSYMNLANWNIACRVGYLITNIYIISISGIACERLYNE